MIAAQKEAGKMAKPGPKPEIGLNDNPNSPTLKEVNIDKNLANSARKAMP
jgi:hypothetical protein